MKLKQIFFGIFNWFKELKSWKMTVKDIQIRLDKEIKDIIDEYEKYLPTDNTGLLQYIGREKNSLLFKLGDKQFLFEGEILITQDVGLIRTYQIVRNKESYPNMKLNHIEDMDIIIKIEPESINSFILQSQTRFVKIKKGVNDMDVTKIQLTQYFWGIFRNQLLKSLGTIEGGQIPKPDEI